MKQETDLERDKHFMRVALKEGYKGLGRTSPNPPVGAVIVKNDKIVGKGYHHRAGTPHAEINALKEAGEDARGATLYVTLEPCNHYGRTPPCTKAILEAGIRRVVIGCRDPHPLAQGGAEFLKSQGVYVTSGVLEEECIDLCRFFLKATKTDLPWVIAKIAMSLDGAIATRTGDSKWITGEEARRYGHRLRNIVDAILVGRRTVQLDDPSLNCRLRGGRDPARIILDTHLCLDLKYKIFNLCSKAPTIVVCGKRASLDREKAFKDKGITVWRLPEENQRVCLLSLLKRLKNEGYLSLLVEGGAEVHGTFFDKGLVDEIYFFYGPVIIGGREAKRPILGQGIDQLRKALRPYKISMRRLKDSFLLHGQISNIQTL